jgi:hypothetical protein
MLASLKSKLDGRSRDGPVIRHSTHDAATMGDFLLLRHTHTHVWRRWYFYFTDKGLEFKEGPLNKEPYGRVNLKMFKITETPATLRFDIVTPSLTYRLAAESAASYGRWIRTLSTLQDDRGLVVPVWVPFHHALYCGEFLKRFLYLIIVFLLWIRDTHTYTHNCIDTHTHTHTQVFLTIFSPFSLSRLQRRASSRFQIRASTTACVAVSFSAENTRAWSWTHTDTR